MFESGSFTFQMGKYCHHIISQDLMLVFLTVTDEENSIYDRPVAKIWLPERQRFCYYELLCQKDVLAKHYLALVTEAKWIKH